MIHVQKSPDQRRIKILQTISLQDYVKRLWNHSNTKIPITIGKGTDTAKPRSKAPQGGAKRCDKTDRQTERQTRQTDRHVLRAAWLKLKINQTMTMI